MVSRVAVIALVAIVACPILLGYAMNLNEVTETDYKSADDPVNVTQLLQTSTEYTYAHADPYSLNTNFMYKDWTHNKSIPWRPDYLKTSNIRTTMELEEYKPAPSVFNTVLNQYFSSFTYYNLVTDYTLDGSNYLQAKIYYGEGSYIYVNNLHQIYYDYSDNSVDVGYYRYAGSSWYNEIDTYPNATNCEIKAIGSPDAQTLISFDYIGNNNYSDVLGGYIVGKYNDSIDPLYYTNDVGVYAVLPDNPKNVFLTMDLSTISASSYSFSISFNNISMNQLRFDKVTDGSGVHWTVYKGRSPSMVKITDLYYDSSRSSNTYQILIDTIGVEFRYVGDWPELVGYANYYQKYTYQWQAGNPISDNIGKLYFFEETPKMRIDDSEYRAFEYQIITNKTYTPADFKTNPSTTIGNPTIYGSSIVFGGNTYAVSDGKITLGSKQIPVKDLVLSSVPTDGGYENRIGNTVISVTADPSTITLNGKWSASISTVSMESYTYTKTEWNAGSFGWDGIDQNFLMVGLLTSIGVFIALGIYIRRTKAALWPLLIVCGGAAMLFFCML